MAVDICVRLGRRIQALRRERGLYQIDLAVKADLTRENLSRIENGRAEAGIRTLARIARALGVSLAELMEGI